MSHKGGIGRGGGVGLINKLTSKWDVIRAFTVMKKIEVVGQILSGTQNSSLSHTHNQPEGVGVMVTLASEMHNLPSLAEDVTP